MIQKLKFSVLLLSATVLLSGCLNLGSPHGAISGAAGAAKSGNFEEYLSTIHPRVKAELGTREKFESLKNSATPFGHVSFRDVVLTHREQGNQGHGHFGDILRVFSGTVRGHVSKNDTGTPIYTAEVECKVWGEWDYSNYDRDCERYHHPPHNGGRHCGGGMPPRWVEFQLCLVSKLDEI